MQFQSKGEIEDLQIMINNDQGFVMQLLYFLIYSYGKFNLQNTTTNQLLLLSKLCVKTLPFHFPFLMLRLRAQMTKNSKYSCPFLQINLLLPQKI